MLGRFLFSLLGILIPLFSFSQVQKLLDPNEDTTTIGSDLRALTAYKGDLYGYANANDRQGLYKLNPVTEEMELVFPDLFISNMVATDSLLIIVGMDPVLGGTRLWRSDGTAIGTSRIESSPWGTYYAPNLISKGHYAYLPINPFNASAEMWSTDGRDSGTEALAEIAFGASGGFTGRITTNDDKIYFMGINDQGELAIIQSDGTKAGTSERLSNPSWAGSNNGPRDLVGLDSLLYFTRNNYLWQIRKDSVVKLKEVPHLYRGPFSFGFPIQSYNGHHYFYGDGDVSTVFDSLRLYRTNGDLGNLELVYTFPKGGNAYSLFPVSQGLITITGGVFGRPDLQLYTSSGMADSVVTLNQHRISGPFSVSQDSVVIFNLNSFTTMRSDGNPAGTYITPNFRWRNYSTRPPDHARIGSDVYFSGSGALSADELYRMRAGSIELLDDIDETPVKSFIREMTLLPNKLVFSARSKGIGQELWVSDGSPAGSGLLKNIYPDSLNNTDFVNGSFPDKFTQGDGLVYFSARDTSDSRYTPFVTDGSPTGTRRITNLWTDDGFSNGDFRLTDHYYWKDKLYFSGAVPIRGIQPDAELYQYDPLSDSAILLKNIETLDFSGFGVGSYPQRFSENDSFLFFVAETIDEGQELWKTDGTEAGTQLVKDIQVGELGSFDNPIGLYPPSFIGLDSLLIFTANERSSGWQLWRSNGTESGTYPLQDTFTYRAIGRMAKLGSRVLFWENEPGRGTILWSTDGSDAGTFALLDSLPFSVNVHPFTLYTNEQIGFFTFYSDSVGSELWVTDGTTGGTRLVKDMAPGIKSSEPASVISIGGDQYLFWAKDSTGDRVLWTTDGTEAGTFMLQDYKQAAGRLVRENRLYLADGFVYFVAEDVQSGEALFRYDLQSTGIREISRQNNFLVYPNPARDKLTIKNLAQGQKFLKQINLIDLQGRQIMDFPVNSVPNFEMEIHLPSQLPNAYYLLRLETDSQVEFHKFFKK